MPDEQYHYRAIRKRDRRGEAVWGVARFQKSHGRPWRQVAWKTIGRGRKGQDEAQLLAAEMDRQNAQYGVRFLSWHKAGRHLPLDRTVRDDVHHHGKVIGTSTAPTPPTWHCSASSDPPSTREARL